jgi:hypothetical protein
MRSVERKLANGAYLTSSKMRSKNFVGVKSGVKSERQLYRQQKKVLILRPLF